MTFCSVRFCSRMTARIAPTKQYVRRAHNFAQQNRTLLTYIMATTSPAVCTVDSTKDACLPTAPLTSVENAQSRLNKDVLYKATLVPVNCSFSVVRPEKDKAQSLKGAVTAECRQNRTNVTILYAMRHPACGACREKGTALAEYAKSDPKVTLATVVKDTKQMDEAILEYYVQYGLRNPIYKDDASGIYKAMGGRKFTLWDILRGTPRLASRMWEKNRQGIQLASNKAGVTKGEYWTQGGVLIFDKRGELAGVVYEPVFGDELDMDLVREGVSAARKANRSSHK